MNELKNVQNSQNKNTNEKILPIGNSSSNEKNDNLLITSKKKNPINFLGYAKLLFYIFTNKKVDTSTVQGKSIEKLKKKIMIVDKIRDYDYIISKIHEMEIVKSMILNEFQIMTLHYLKKDEKVVESLDSYKYQLILKDDVKINYISDYFVNLLSETQISGNDEFLFTRLDKNIKEKILTDLYKKQNQ